MLVPAVDALETDVEEQVEEDSASGTLDGWGSGVVEDEEEHKARMASSRPHLMPQ